MTFAEFTMTFFGKMLVYTLLATFTENTIFSRALGSSTSLWIIRKRYQILSFGIIMTVITTVSSVGAYLVLPFVRETQYYLSLIHI